MASEYLKKAYGLASPRVALLNIGTEEGKGDTLRKEAYPLFQNCKAINFVGNMEARELTSGSYDVVACDGFSGNVLIKATEGTGIGLLKLLKKTFFKNLKNKIGALFLKKDIYGIKDFMCYEQHGVEADDIAGTIAKMASKENDDVTLYTSDKDYLQLIDKNTKVSLLKVGLSNM